MYLNKLILSFCFLVATNQTYATVQESDLLIIGNDTLYLKSFPLEQLELAIKPFDNTREFAPSTACWRGYRAVWRIINDSLFLEKIIRCYSDNRTGEQDIQDLFKKSLLNVKVKNDLVFAHWYSSDWYKMTNAKTNYFKNEIYLYEGGNKKKRLILRIENGRIIINNLITHASD